MQRGRPEAIVEGALALQKRADDKAFAWINAGTYSAVFLLFLILPRFGLQNYIFPGFVGLLGLHFLPMPNLYRHASNVVAGACMIAWAVFCAVVFKADGNREAAYVALGCRDDSMEQFRMGNGDRKASLSSGRSEGVLT